MIEIPPPGFEHGKICVEMIYRLKIAAQRDARGVVVGNDSGVITLRQSDTVRGADVAYYCRAKADKIGATQGYPVLPPDLVVQVRSPGDR